MQIMNVCTFGLVLELFFLQLFTQLSDKKWFGIRNIFLDPHDKNKGIGDAGSTADFRMLWSAIVCLGLGLL